MHRTQLYLDEARYEYLSALARQKGTSIAQVVRDLIDKERNRRKKRRGKADPIWEMVGIIEDERKDIASNYESYLYDEGDST